MRIELELNDIDSEAVLSAKKKGTSVSQEVLAVIGDIFLSNL